MEIRRRRDIRSIARRDIQWQPEKASRGRILCFRPGYTWTKRILPASTIRKMNNCHIAIPPTKNAVQFDWTALLSGAWFVAARQVQTPSIRRQSVDYRIDERGAIRFRRRDAADGARYRYRRPSVGRQCVCARAVRVHAVGRAAWLSLRTQARVARQRDPVHGRVGGLRMRGKHRAAADWPRDSGACRRIADSRCDADTLVRQAVMEHVFAAGPPALLGAYRDAMAHGFSIAVLCSGILSITIAVMLTMRSETEKQSGCAATTCVTSSHPE